MQNKECVFIALGTNLGDRQQNLVEALRRLPPAVTVTSVSRVYETAPAYVLNQPPFLNAVIGAETTLPPAELLAYLKRLEVEIGRAKTVRYGPRKIDLDILFYGEQRVTLSQLQIPHPRLQERGFVLHPLADIAPDFVHPTLGLTVRQMLAALPSQNGVLNVSNWQPLTAALAAG
ncbi:MAG: 2-amino-4-hydroxy-6-hydroxymethyldihydropteridine diphosphokinase [Chloroflexi bacterium]|nr:MAG: 2-amino-4-hydroxy-6-hydroxymethyldihydropteridine diphosphokinase [Chloroflexota bacterium]